MDTFINNMRQWLVDNISSVMTNLVLPVGSLILLVVGIFNFITGIMKLRGQKDDSKSSFIWGIACIAGAVVLGSVWLWARTAAGV